MDLRVGLLVAIVIDTLSWHLPLYRQHQRMQQAGLKISRAWLTQLVQLTCVLLDPSVDAQLASVIASRILAMDETPLLADKSETPGKMKRGQIWPLFGDQNEVHFHYSPSWIFRFMGSHHCGPWEATIPEHVNPRRSSSAQVVPD